MYFDANSYISRVDAADMLGVSRGYMQDSEKQGKDLPLGISRYFAEINESMEILRRHPKGKIAFYEQKQIMKLKDLLERRNAAKRIFKSR